MHHPPPDVCDMNESAIVGVDGGFAVRHESARMPSSNHRQRAGAEDDFGVELVHSGRRVCAGAACLISRPHPDYRPPNAKGRSASAEVQLRPWSCSQRLPCDARNRLSGSACERALDPPVVAATAGWKLVPPFVSLEMARGKGMVRFGRSDNKVAELDES